MNVKVGIKFPLFIFLCLEGIILFLFFFFQKNEKKECNISPPFKEQKSECEECVEQKCEECIECKVCEEPEGTDVYSPYRPPPDYESWYSDYLDLYLMKKEKFYGKRNKKRTPRNNGPFSEADKVNGLAEYMIDNRFNEPPSSINHINGNDLFMDIDPEILGQCDYSSYPPNVQGGLVKILGDCLYPPQKLDEPIFILVGYAEGCCQKALNRLKRSFLDSCGSYFKEENVYMLDESFVDSWFIDHYRHIAINHRGGGMWYWKPFIISKVLSKYPISEDVILIYIDADLYITKDFCPVLDELALNERKMDFINVMNIHPNTIWTKRDLYDIMDVPFEYFKETQITQNTGGVQFWRNTYFSKFYRGQLMKYTHDLRLSSFVPSTRKNEKEFRDHRNEMSIMDALGYKYGVKEGYRTTYLREERGLKVTYDKG